MIPLGDDVPGERFPFVTYVLIGANVLVFLYEVVLSHQELLALTESLGMVPARLALWRETPAELLTLFTSMYLHGGWLHLLGNMLYLWIFGNNVEDRTGHGGFFLFYTLCGITAAFVEALIGPGQTVPMIGASGAVAGVLGAYVLLFPRARVFVFVPVFLFFFTVRVPAVIMLGFWFLFQLIGGAAGFGIPVQSGGIAHWAHVGGFLSGMFLLPLFLNDRRKPLRYVYECRGRECRRFPWRDR